MVIKGDKINLIEISENDLLIMMEWRNDKDNRKYFFSQEIITFENQKKWYQSYLKKDNDKMFIIKTKNDISIGTIALYNINIDKKYGEIGRILIGDKKFRRMGYATRAIKLLINKAFEIFKLEEIFLQVSDNNRNAINLYKKCGFVINKQSQYKSIFKINNNVLLMYKKSR